MRVEIKPEMLLWALKRSGKHAGDFKAMKVDEWIRGDELPTLRQAESFAKRTHTPFGYFFLEEPPEIEVDLPDLRTIGGHGLSNPSQGLVDTIHACERRQAWFSDMRAADGHEQLDFIGSQTLNDSAVDAATAMADTLQMSRAQDGDWVTTLRDLSRSAEEAGVRLQVDCNRVCPQSSRLQP